MEDLWTALVGISRSIIQGPRVVMEDFNNVLNLEDNIGSSVTLEEVTGFGQCVRICCLQDMGVCGPFYTWSNKQEGNNRVFSKIDMIFCNEEWLQRLRDANATFFKEVISYHCPCIIKLDNTIIRRSRSFKYCNMWSMADEFIEIVNEY